MTDARVTQLLSQWAEGDEQALSALMPLIYDQLQRLARGHMARERTDHTLQPTGLVHEAFLRMAGQRSAHWQNRAHFLAVASQMMRRILVNHARNRIAAKRGGGAPMVSMNDTAFIEEPMTQDFGGTPSSGTGELFDKTDGELVALDEALTKLEAEDPQQSRVVELRYFGGLTVEETAQAMSISPATVKREWAVARLWLKRALGEQPTP